MTIFMPFVTPDKYVKMYNLVCEPSPKWAENVTCDLKVIGRNIVIANMEMDARNPFNNISVHFKAFKFYNQFRPFLIDVNFSMCDILNKSTVSNFYNNLVLRILKKYSNAIQCPLKVSNLILLNYLFYLFNFRDIFTQEIWR